MAFTLDTNILLHLLKGSEIAQRVTEEYFTEESPTLIISIVTQGELESIAFQRDYGVRKLKDLQKLLTQFLMIPVNNKELVQKYAEIDAFSQGKLKGKPLPKGMSSRNMGKNDLWIAATASVTNTTLITTDRDFNHIADSGFLNVVHIDQG